MPFLLPRNLIWRPILPPSFVLSFVSVYIFGESQFKRSETHCVHKLSGLALGTSEARTWLGRHLVIGFWQKSNDNILFHQLQDFSVLFYTFWAELGAKFRHVCLKTQTGGRGGGANIRLSETADNIEPVLLTCWVNVRKSLLYFTTWSTDLLQSVERFPFDYKDKICACKSDMYSNSTLYKLPGSPLLYIYIAKHSLRSKFVSCGYWQRKRFQI